MRPLTSLSAPVRKPESTDLVANGRHFSVDAWLKLVAPQILGAGDGIVGLGVGEPAVLVRLAGHWLNLDEIAVALLTLTNGHWAHVH